MAGPAYRDYVAAFKQKQATDRANGMDAGGAAAMSEQEWNAMPLQKRGSMLDWMNVTNGGEHAAITPEQIAAFKAKFGDAAFGDKSDKPGDSGFTTSYDGFGGTIRTGYSGDINDSVLDPSRIYQDPTTGQYISENSNVSKSAMDRLRAANALESSKGNGFSKAVKTAIAVGGGVIAAGAGGMLGAEGLGAGGGMIDAPYMANFATPEIGAMSAAPSFGGAAGGGGLAALGAGGGGGIEAPLMSNFAAPTVTGTMAPTPAAAGGGLGGFLANNGGTLARAGMGLASLGAGSKPAAGMGGSGPGGVAGIIDQMANANRVDQTTPLGSRKWSQDEGGRWSVADTMNPAEQSNFENVQGMNASMTDMAKKRLAALLAAPAMGRADAPLNVGRFKIGG